MPKDKKRKSSGINLIKKEVTFENRLRRETQWYSSFNFVVILTITAIGGLAYALTLFNNSSLYNRKVDLVNYANESVNVQQKFDIEDKIDIINNKYTLYQQVKGQSIDAKKFYEDVTALYPGIKLERFSYRPGQIVETQLTLPTNAYEELPKFLNALYAKYSDIVITKITFDSSSNSATDTAVSASLSINFPNTTEIEEIESN